MVDKRRRTRASRASRQIVIWRVPAHVHRVAHSRSFASHGRLLATTRRVASSSTIARVLGPLGVGHPAALSSPPSVAMKRGPDVALPSTPPKRRRASPTEEVSDTLDSETLFSDPCHQCTIEAVLQGSINPDAYISGTVTMRLLPQNGHTWFILKTSSGKNVKAEFRNKCSPHFELLKGNFKEEVKLRLKGATVIKPESGDTPTLLYEQGTSLMFTKSRDSARVGKVIDTWSRKYPRLPFSSVVDAECMPPEVDKAAAQMEETEPVDSDYVEGNDWYGTPSRSRRQPSDAVPPPSSVSTEAPASTAAKKDGDSHPAAPQDVPSSRLAASTSSFSPSVQLAATRRSPSAAPPAPVIVTSHAETAFRAEDVLPGADSQRAAASHPPDVSSAALPTKSHIQIAEVPVTNHDGHEASHIGQPQPDIARHDSTTAERPTRTAPATKKAQGKEDSAPLSKKLAKRRARKERQLLSRRESNPPGERSRTSLPTDATHPDNDGSPTVSSETSTTQAARDAPEDHPTREDTEARPSTEASHPSRASPPPKSVEQAGTDEQVQTAAQPRSPSLPRPSQPERKPEEAERSPSAASARVTPKTEAADGPQTLLVGFRSEYVRFSVAICAMHHLLRLHCAGLLLATSQSRKEGQGLQRNCYRHLCGLHQPDVHRWSVHFSVPAQSQCAYDDAEFKTALSLSDPSVHEQGGFSVNMFAKRSAHLPEPARGDVIMIRGVLVRSPEIDIIAWTQVEAYARATSTGRNAGPRPHTNRGPGPSSTRAPGSRYGRRETSASSRHRRSCSTVAPSASGGHPSPPRRTLGRCIRSGRYGQDGYTAC